VIFEISRFKKCVVSEDSILYRDCPLIFEYIFEKLTAKIRKDPGSPNIKDLILGKGKNSESIFFEKMG